MKDKERKLILLSKALSDDVTKRITELFLQEKNPSLYHNQIHRIVGGSKTAVSKALHILADEYGIMEGKYEQIPAPNPNPHERKISVLMFHIKDEYFEILRQFRVELLNKNP